MINRFLSAIFVTVLLVVMVGCGAQMETKPTQSEDESIAVAMSSYETYTKINDTVAFMESYLQEFTSLLDDLEADTDVTTDEIEEYEIIWTELAMESSEWVASLHSVTPASEYSKAWENMVLFVESLEDIAHKLSDWDTNDDGEYNSSECSAVVQYGIDECTKASDSYFRQFGEQFLAIPEPSESSSTSNFNGNHNSTQITFTNKYGTPTTKCAHTGCSSYIANSGDTNCCEEHSNRCLDCNKYIDEDAYWCVSCIAAAVSPTCEVCGKDAAYSIDGLTGQTEYYCSEHYNEMKELWDSMSNN